MKNLKIQATLQNYIDDFRYFADREIESQTVDLLISSKDPRTGRPNYSCKRKDKEKLEKI